MSVLMLIVCLISVLGFSSADPVPHLSTDTPRDSSLARHEQVKALMSDVEKSVHEHVKFIFDEVDKQTRNFLETTIIQGFGGYLNYTLYAYGEQTNSAPMQDNDIIIIAEDLVSRQDQEITDFSKQYDLSEEK